MSMPKFVVVTVFGDASSNGYVAEAASSLEEAIRARRRSEGLRFASPGTTVYAMPLADFIKHATPEKRDYRVTRVTTETVRIDNCTSAEEATAKAKTFRYGEYACERHNVEALSVEVVK